MLKNLGGIYAGQVVSIKDPEHRGRVKVKIAEVLGEATSNWCEPCVPCCFENGGDFCLPELKDYVWVVFMNGELDSPVYLGGWWTQDSTPLGDNYNNIDSTRIISFGNMQIKFNSDKDSIDIISSDGDSKKVLSVNPEKVCIDGKSISSGGGGSIDVDEDFSETSENPLMNKVVTKALKEKVDTVNGKGLSTNDFDNTYKKNVDENTNHRSDKVLHITSEERKTWNSKSDFSGLFSDLYGIPDWVNSETKPKYSKSEVGLSNVDNTSDLDKPISNSVQKALDNKVDNDTLTTHTGNSVIHITSEERETWNSKSDFSGNYSDLKGKPYKLSDFEDDLGNNPVHTHSQYLTSESLSGYATESWVTNKNYLTKITKEQVVEALGYTPPTTDTNTWRGIQNNLTSTSTTDSLSAYQGKVLQDEIEEINSNLCELSNNNSTSNLCGTKAYTEKLYYAPLNVGDKFTISKKDTSLSIGGTTQEILQFDENGNKVDFWSLYNNNLPRTITCVKDSVYLGFKEDASNCPFMVNYGEVKPYQEYNGCSNLGLTYRVDKQNESLNAQGLDNKFDGVFYQGYFDTNGTEGNPTQSNVYVVNKNPINVSAGDVVNLKYFGKITTTIFAQFYKSDGTNNGVIFIDNGSDVDSIITVPTNSKTMHINIGNSNGITPNDVSSLYISVNNEIAELKNDLDDIVSNVDYTIRDYASFKGDILLSGNRIKIKGEIIPSRDCGPWWGIMSIPFHAVLDKRLTSNQFYIDNDATGIYCNAKLTANTSYNIDMEFQVNVSPNNRYLALQNSILQEVKNYLNTI